MSDPWASAEVTREVNPETMPVNVPVPMPGVPHGTMPLMPPAPVPPVSVPPAPVGADGPLGRTAVVPAGDTQRGLPDQTDPESGGVFHRGVARVLPQPRAGDPAPHTTEPAEAPWTGGAPVPVRSRIRQLRIGSEWTSFGVLFAFVCWGIWAISTRGDFGGLIVSFFLVLLIAAGLFILMRLLGKVVLERSLGRTRRSALGSHVATCLFLIAAGIAFLGQTPWVVDVWVWVKHLFW